ncbi:unnamed protein product [Brachionus calyciflorus]|uniref:Uncharacterized protein n=1 Tax=Brachionus calyciflorus TaxID=104777 RepID=A0A813N727_9BILA|nr:unnamed protein product [Brachionus calyciflorus]
MTKFKIDDNENISAYDYYKFYLKNSRLLSIAWLLMTICFTICIIIIFVSPEWIGDSLQSNNQGYFGLYRFCIRNKLGISYRCFGMWTDFSTLPKVPSIKAACFFVGFSCLLSLICTFIYIFSLVVKLERIMHICAWIQLLILICFFIGITIYPIGWDSSIIRTVCGKEANQLKLGTCTLRWPYILACILVFQQLFLTILAFLLAGRQAKYLLEYAAQQRTQLTEGLYTIFIRDGQEWKWGSPLLFIYMVFAYIPCMIYSNLTEFKSVPESCVSKNNFKETNKTLKINNNNPFTEKSIRSAIMEIFFLIVIFTRWLLPKGKITLEELSKLLLIYISSIADILDMMKLVKYLNYSNCAETLKVKVFFMSNVSLFFAIVQLSLGLTAKRRSKTQDIDVKKVECNLCMDNKIGSSVSKISSTNKDNFNKKHKGFIFNQLSRFKRWNLKFLNKLQQSFEKEVWGIFVLLIFKDLPFTLIRTYAFIVSINCILWDHSFFFMLKGYFFIIIQLNRCYIIFNEDKLIKNQKDKKENYKNGLENTIQDTTNSHFKQSSSGMQSTSSKSTYFKDLVLDAKDLEQNISFKNSDFFQNENNKMVMSKKHWSLLRKKGKVGVLKNIKAFKK